MPCWPYLSVKQRAQVWAYGWAALHPERKIFFNLVLTVVSAVIAIVVAASQTYLDLSVATMFRMVNDIDPVSLDGPLGAGSWRNPSVENKINMITTIGRPWKCWAVSSSKGTCTAASGTWSNRSTITSNTWGAPTLICSATSRIAWACRTGWLGAPTYCLGMYNWMGAPMFHY